MSAASVLRGVGSDQASSLFLPQLQWKPVESLRQRNSTGHKCRVLGGLQGGASMTLSDEIQEAARAEAQG